MKALKRETTIANLFPAPLSPPSIAGIAASEGCSIFIFSFVDSLRASVVNRLLIFDRPITRWPDDLFPLKHRRTLLQKCRSPFLLVFGRAAYPKQRSLQKQPLRQSHL